MNLNITVTKPTNQSLAGLILMALTVAGMGPLHQFYMFLCLIMFWRLLKQYIHLQYVEA